MITKIFNYICNMKKQILIGTFIVIISLIILLPKSCNRQIKLPENNNGWEILKNEKEKELLKKDSLYLDLKIKTDLKIKELEKERIAQELKYLKQLNDLKKKYDQEYYKVSNTSIDSTISISSKHISEKIDYSKFQK